MEYLLIPCWDMLSMCWRGVQHVWHACNSWVVVVRGCWVYGAAGSGVLLVQVWLGWVVKGSYGVTGRAGLDGRTGEDSHGLNSRDFK